MKFDKLFKKLEKFFNMDDELEKAEKKDKLELSLDEKIVSMQEKITNSKRKRKKEKLKKQLNVLKELKEKL